MYTNIYLGLPVPVDEPSISPERLCRLYQPSQDDMTCMLVPSHLDRSRNAQCLKLMFI